MIPAPESNFLSVSKLPDAKVTVEVFREEVTRAGLPNPWLVGINGHCWKVDTRKWGFDATLDFSPQLGVYMPDVIRDKPSMERFKRNLKWRLLNRQLKIYDDRESRSRMLALKKDADKGISTFI